MNYKNLMILASLFACGSALAEVKVGIILSETGPAASVGATQLRTVGILPSKLGGQQVQYIVLDDASDPSQAVKDAHKLIDERQIDVLIGPSLSPSSLALLDIVASAETPMISLAGAGAIVSPVDNRRRWVFKTPQSDAQMAELVVTNMSAAGVKSYAFVGFNDAYGDGWLEQMGKYAKLAGIRQVASERYSKTDASVVGQMLKVMSSRPDAVFIAASGTPAALPQVFLHEHGYQGMVYQTHGVANNDFLRIGGKAVEGTLLPAGPVLVAEQLPRSHPARQPALDFVQKYEALPGAGIRSTFAAYLWDASLILDHAIESVPSTVLPGSKDFREALRNAIEKTTDLHATNGVYTMSPSDHLGLDARGRVMVKIVDGKWKLQP